MAGQQKTPAQPPGREERLAARLRENLKKRKEQARQQREGVDDKPSDEQP